MPKSRNRSRDIRKRAAKKRANKLRLERQVVQDRLRTTSLYYATQLFDEAELLANCNQNKIMDEDPKGIESNEQHK
jgi:hypothetical protein